MTETGAVAVVVVVVDVVLVVAVVSAKCFLNVINTKLKSNQNENKPSVTIA